MMIHDDVLQEEAVPVTGEGFGGCRGRTGWKNMPVEINTVSATVLYFDRRRVRLWEFQISVVFSPSISVNPESTQISII